MAGRSTRTGLIHATQLAIDPALVALMALVDRRPSSSSASRTPQVKAPCAPPPCRASETGRGEADRLRVDGEEADPVIAISPSIRHQS